MGITKFAVKYPVSVLMLTLAVCLLGTISYNKLGTDLFPDLKNPALYVEVKSGQRPICKPVSVHLKRSKNSL